MNKYPQKFMAGSIESWGPAGWYWPENDFGVWEGPKEDWQLKFQPWISDHVKNKTTVLQAGGACGMYPRLLSGMFETVYTFEPDPQNFYFLNLNCPNFNIKKFNCALGDRHRNITFYPPSETNRGVGKTGRDEDHGADPLIGDTPVLMVDDFCFTSLDLMLLDIENYEYYALAGSINTIEKHKPVIICESATDKIASFLAKFGYVVAENRGADTLFKVENGTVS